MVRRAFDAAQETPLPSGYGMASQNLFGAA